MRRKLDFIVNPQASNGRCGKIFSRRIERALRRDDIPYGVHRTTGPGDAVRLARELAPGARAIVSVGGDGTHSEVTTGLVQAGLPQPKLQVAFLTLGTGGDWRKTLGLPVEPVEQWRRIRDDLRERRTTWIDVARLRYVDNDGHVAERGFVNITSFGVGGEVDERVNQTTKAFGGFASFFIGSLRATLAYRNRQVRVAVDGREVYHGPVFNVAVANGRYFGGGMHVAPQARPDDGLFDIVVMGDLSLAQKLLVAPRLYQGAHLGLPGIASFRGRVVEATSDERVLLDVDGEQPGRLPATLTIVPEALRVLGARVAVE